MRGVSGNGNYPKHDDGLQSGCVDMGKMIFEKLSVDYQVLNKHATGKTGNHLTQ
jgi:hypothetical protein